MKRYKKEIIIITLIILVALAGISLIAWKSLEIANKSRGETSATNPTDPNDKSYNLETKDTRYKSNSEVKGVENAKDKDSPASTGATSVDAPPYQPPSSTPYSHAVGSPSSNAIEDARLACREAVLDSSNRETEDANATTRREVAAVLAPSANIDGQDVTTPHGQLLIKQLIRDTYGGNTPTTAAKTAQVDTIFVRHNSRVDAASSSVINSNC